jgi:hypothetical protein
MKQGQNMMLGALIGACLVLWGTVLSRPSRASAGFDSIADVVYELRGIKNELRGMASKCK